MKGGKPHRVPLSPQAVAILEQARPMRNDSGLIFPSVQTGKAMTSATLKETYGKSWSVGKDGRAWIQDVFQDMGGRKNGSAACG